ncbi:MAG: ABC transporter ATP-binding protein/permease [Lachnospiraceae bacterium]|nr:ABC transporter ATP-binding protein/permease [Lachnospiraceae bacterium]
MADVIRKLAYIFNRRQKRNMVLLLAMIFLGALLELCGVSLIMPLVTILSSPGSIRENALLSALCDAFGIGDAGTLFVFLACFIIAFFILKNIYLTVMYRIQYRFVYHNQLKISGRLIDCYLRKPYTYHLEHNPAEMIRNVMLDSERLFQLILQLLNMTSEILLSGLLAAYLLVSDPAMTLTIACLLLLCMGGYQKLTRKRVNRYGQVNQFYDGKMHQAVNEALGAVKDIKILRREEYFVDSFVSAGQKKMDALINMNFFGTLPRYLIEAVCVGGILAVMIVKVHTGTDLKTILPQLTAFAVAAVKLLPSVGKISNYLNGISFLKPSIDLIYRDLKETEDMLGISAEEEPEDVFPAGSRTIRIEDVSFAYPNSQKDVLSHASFTIPLGTSVGFVGPTGSGKSTMADLILGILAPKEGHVYYGDVDVHRYPAGWARKLAYIPQSIYLADKSIRENVAFGVAGDEIDDAAVWAALEEAQLTSFIRSLPEGLDTEVGERGVRLSGGQKQRIGIARALYGDPEILVLDEATSALDGDTEKAVMEAIERLHGRKTLLIIAHRLSTIAGCDQIFEVRDGGITEADKENVIEGDKG